MLGDYAQIRVVPALASVLFIAASALQFGAIEPITVTWLDFTLDTSYSMVVSLGVFALAFASSETKSFEHYDQWEQIVIGLGPALILGHEFVPALSDFIASIGDPTGYAIAFVVTMASWAVAVR
jgi:hypothetical protein